MQARVFYAHRDAIIWKKWRTAHIDVEVNTLTESYEAAREALKIKANDWVARTSVHRLRAARTALHHTYPVSGSLLPRM